MAIFRRVRDNEDFQSSFVENEDGITFIEFGEIDTADEKEAALASGLPEVGDTLDDADYDNVTLRTIEITPLYGGQKLGEGAFPNNPNPGWSKVKLTWSSVVRGSGSTKPTKPGQKFTTVAYTRSQQTAYFGVDMDTPSGLGYDLEAPVESVPPLALCPPINDGDGVGVNVTKMEVTVTKAYSKLNTPNYAAWPSLCDKLNNGALTLPAIFGSKQTWSAPKGSLRYIGPEVEPQGDLIVVRHKFEFAPDHYLRFQTRKKDGTIGKRYRVRLENFADLSGLV